MKKPLEDKLLIEGIDIDYANFKVKYNPRHQNNVNTSEKENPTVDNEVVPGIPVWSIFTRNSLSMMDGNPLIYAMKKERHWTFGSKKDKDAILRQFDKILDKFLSTHHYDITLVIPTSSHINEFMASEIIEKDPSVEYIDGVLVKLTVDDIWSMVNTKDSRFMKHYRKDGSRAVEDALTRLDDYLGKMKLVKRGKFTRHLIDDEEMRNVLDATLKHNPDPISEDAAKITGHDVLIIDDTISRGQTIREAVKTIRDNYKPKSISVLTMFSKLK